MSFLIPIIPTVVSSILGYIIKLVSSKFKARKIIQTCEISECTGNAGEQKQIKGTLKGGDFVYGTFNVSTKTFTENA